MAYTKTAVNDKIYIKANATINLTIVDPSGKLSGVDLSYITQNGGQFGGKGLVTKGVYNGKEMTTTMDVTTDINLRVVKDVQQAKSTDYIIQAVNNIPGDPVGLTNNKGADVGAVEDKYSGKQFANIALHELGHIMGLEHVKANSNLMSETLDTKVSGNSYRLLTIRKLIYGSN